MFFLLIWKLKLSYVSFCVSRATLFFPAQETFVTQRNQSPRISKRNTDIWHDYFVSAGHKLFAKNTGMSFTVILRVLSCYQEGASFRVSFDGERFHKFAFNPETELKSLHTCAQGSHFSHRQIGLSPSLLPWFCLNTPFERGLSSGPHLQWKPVCH